MLIAANLVLALQVFDIERLTLVRIDVLGIFCA